MPKILDVRSESRKRKAGKDGYPSPSSNPVNRQTCLCFLGEPGSVLLQVTNIAGCSRVSNLVDRGIFGDAVLVEGNLPHLLRIGKVVASCGQGPLSTVHSPESEVQGRKSDYEDENEDEQEEKPKQKAESRNADTPFSPSLADSRRGEGMKDGGRRSEVR